jgi:hypothetical protein
MRNCNAEQVEIFKGCKTWIGSSEKNARTTAFICVLDSALLQQSESFQFHGITNFIALKTLNFFDLTFVPYTLKFSGAKWCLPVVQ